MGTITDSFLHNINWSEESAFSSVDYSKFYSNHIAHSVHHDTNHVEHFHLLFLSTKANAEDNPSWSEATNGLMSKGFWKAMDTELETLTRKEAWDIVDRTENMNVLESTRAFKVKRYPDGTLRKLKARFCV